MKSRFMSILDKSIQKMLLVSSPDVKFVADCRRLGVGVDECRQVVIREAATKRCSAYASSSTLANRSTVAEKQLCTVATSAYRLLDPRRRPDAIQRAHIGRVVPIASTLAGRSVYPDTSLMDQPDEPATSTSMTWNANQNCQTQRKAHPNDITPKKIFDVVPELSDWTASLQSNDLLQRRPTGSRRIRRGLLRKLGWTRCLHLDHSRISMPTIYWGFAGLVVMAGWAFWML